MRPILRLVADVVSFAAGAPPVLPPKGPLDLSPGFTRYGSGPPHSLGMRGQKPTQQRKQPPRLGHIIGMQRRADIFA